MNGIQFPEFATFEIRPRTDDPSVLQFRADKVLPDGRKLMLIIDTRCRLNPPTGFAVRVRPGRVIFNGTKNVLATCFYEKLVEEKTEKILVSERPMTGRFLGDEPKMDPEEARAKLARAKNVLRSLGELPKPKAKVADKKATKKKGKEPDKKQARKRLMQRATA